MVVLVVCALVVVGLAVALAFGGLSRLSVHAPEATSSAGGRPLPSGEFFSEDLDGVRFDTALRGYRMDQVDATIERLRDRLAELEDELAGAAPDDLGDLGFSAFPVPPAWQPPVEPDTGEGDVTSAAERESPR
ncbi:MAG: DivIVA domain-containing protein [Mobilicoccus sp.]|nr:DivIVA domain-containing protein [Mobilicoccus sp.]